MHRTSKWIFSVKNIGKWFWVYKMMRNHLIRLRKKLKGSKIAHFAVELSTFGAWKRTFCLHPLDWVLYRHNAANMKMYKYTTVYISFKGSGPVLSHVLTKDGLSIRWQDGLLLVLFLSVGNDVNQVLVVQVPCYIWGEGSEHLLHLTEKQNRFIRALSCHKYNKKSVCMERCDDDSLRASFFLYEIVSDVDVQSSWWCSSCCAFLDSPTHTKQSDIIMIITANVPLQGRIGLLVLLASVSHWTGKERKKHCMRWRGLEEEMCSS